jgi:FkbM family methyltransferase
MNCVKWLIAALLRRLGNKLSVLAARMTTTPAKLVRRGEGRDLYATPIGDLLWLNTSGYLDRQIIDSGSFEAASMSAVRRLVREGDAVLDVGANIGYYTVRFGKLVGATGRVIAAEPTSHFRNTLERNIVENGLTNVQVLDYGFSDRADTVAIDIGPSSATMHSPPGFDRVLSRETIKLSRLDDVQASLGLQRLDFMKIDVDGHEPYVLRGAWSVLGKYSPIILMEISHLHYFQAGVFGWDFYSEIRDRGLRIYRETDFSEITSLERFLRECCNFDRSANIILAARPLQ